MSEVAQAKMQGSQDSNNPARAIPFHSMRAPVLQMWKLKPRGTKRLASRDAAWERPVQGAPEARLRD